MTHVQPPITLVLDGKDAIQIETFEDMSVVDKLHPSTDIYELSRFILGARNYWDCVAGTPVHPDPMTTSSKISHIVEIWICKLQKISYAWRKIAEKPDYGFNKFKKRMWPYFTLDSKEWKASVQDSKSYPNAILGRETPEPASFEMDPFDDEELPPQYNNNYLSVVASDAALPSELEKLISILDSLGHTKYLFEASLLLILHPTTCHIIMHPRFWELLRAAGLNASDKHILNYAMFYAMFILKHEDTILFTKTSKRTLLKYEQYSALPDFQSTMGLNPYVAVLTTQCYVTQCTPWYLMGKREFTTPAEFHNRFRLITGGCLEGLDLKKYNACVAGSILYPCMVKSPLEKNFMGVSWDIPRFFWKSELMGDNHEFLHYMEFYYPSYASLKDEDYQKHATAPAEVVVQEEFHFDIVKTEPHKKQEGETAAEQTKFARREVGDAIPKAPPMKGQTAAGQTKFARREVEGEQKTRVVNKKSPLVLTDIDIAVNAKTFKEFILSAFYIFNHVESRCDKPVYLTKVNSISSFKFAISGPGLIRPIEIFRIYYSHKKMTKKFHMPNVRAYFEGQNGRKDPSMEDLYAHRAFITAAKSGINEDYRWFSCNKIPVKTCLKNVQRGITTILNSREIDSAQEYLTHDTQYPKMVMGCVNRKHSFFSDPDNGIRKGLKRFVLTHSRVDATISVEYKPTLTPYDKILTAVKSSKLLPPSLDIIRAYVDHKKEELLEETL